MTRTVLALLLLCTPTQAGEYLAGIAIAAGATAGEHPQPKPPSDVCDNCNGTGKLGDGTVSVPCPVCGGDGKIGAPPKRTIFTPPVAPKPAARQLITSPRWLENGHGATVGHLISAHGFTRAQLAGLSQRQLDDLHSDAHNRARSRTVTRTTTSACPSGNCPNKSVRRGVFRRR